MGLKHATPLRHLYISTVTVFKIPAYLLIFGSSSILFFVLLIAFPAYTIPGNDFAFQLSLMGNSGLALLILLSLLTGLTTTFHTYIWKRLRHRYAGVKIASDSALSIFSGLVASVFGTATCGVCVATFFGFFGFGTVLFLLKWRLQIVAVAIFLSLISIYYLSRKITTDCPTCRIK